MLDKATEDTIRNSIEIPEDQKNLVIPRRITAMIEEEGLKVSDCCIRALTEKVYRECLMAIERVKADDKKIVKAQHVE